MKPSQWSEGPQDPLQHVGMNQEKKKVLFASYLFQQPFCDSHSSLPKEREIGGNNKHMDFWTGNEKAFE